MRKILRYINSNDLQEVNIFSGTSIGQATFALGDTRFFARFSNSSVVTTQAAIPLKTEWESMYNVYHVTWVDITLTWINTTAQGWYVGMLVLPNSPTAAPSTSNWQTLKVILNTDPNARVATVLPYGNGDRAMATLKMKVNLTRVGGQSLNTAADTNYYSNINASPASCVPLWLFMLTLDGTNVTANTFMPFNMKCNMGTTYSRKDLEAN